MLIAAVELLHGSSQANAQNAGTSSNPSINIPGNNNILNFGNNNTVKPSDAPVQDQASIYQAGIVVGKAFGARRLPNDATTFQFTEITNCPQFNTNAPFTYGGVKLKFVSERDSAMMVMGRQQDSPIRFGVLAKVIDKIPLFQHRNHITNFPELVGDASRHRGSDLQRLMDADEIVIHHVQRDGVRVVLDLLRESVCQPSKPAHVHAHGEIAALGKRRADMFRVRIAIDRDSGPRQYKSAGCSGARHPVLCRRFYKCA